ncbi:PucR family transcriptional regulator [Brevibacillus sp. SYP-B805]|uniref:PucR family transcriptional regulator n=1 Tax=Brevibacillus sp. SYP-B805 TaxID=1578199 RepID=UPI0013ED1DC4|nr:PucR family transcriptional regulator [Brevibacillus sp. SYP-B805]NGQ97071.1 PucR family transcriptional regulator [Brevibacillus sp. SYP-B805]
MTITIREALQLPDMVQTRLVAGANGLDNQIRWVTIVEVLEDASRLMEGEFLITTGFGLEGDPVKLKRFIPSLAERKLSGVALHTGFYLREIPPILIETADRYHLPLIEIPVEMNFSTVTKAILQPIINRQFETLAYSEAIHNRMINAALSKGGLPAIARELVQLTGGEVEIADALGYDLVRLAPDTAPPPAGQTERKTRQVPIRAHRETYGTLTLCKPAAAWKELDDVALQHAATLCALEYVKERAVSATEWRLKGDFAEELLSGRITVGAEAEARSRMLGYPLAGSHLIAGMRIAAGQQEDLPLLHQKLNTLLTRLADRSGLHYLLRERAAYLLMILPDQRSSHALLQQLALQWQRLDPAHPLQIGVSNPRAHVSEIPEAAQEALFALQAYPLLADVPQVLSYAGMKGYQFLFPYHQQPEKLEQLWRPLLGQLVAHDAKHGQQLLETLDAYFAQGLNGLQTAQALYIHRHTLKYRLQQIESKTGCSLEDAAARWQLQLALMAYRLHRLLYPA